MPLRNLVMTHVALDCPRERGYLRVIDLSVTADAVRYYPLSDKIVRHQTFTLACNGGLIGKKGMRSATPTVSVICERIRHYRLNLSENSRYLWPDVKFEPVFEITIGLSA